MSSLKAIWKCMFSPKLIQLCGSGTERLYEPSRLEKWGDQVINSFSIVWKLGVYTSPLWGLMLYHRGYFTPQGLTFMTKIVAGVGFILIISFCARSYGRAQNLTYQRFLDILERTERDVTSRKAELMKYDFDFTAWPVEYDLSNTKSKVVATRKLQLYETPLNYLVSIPFNIIAFFAIHTFGIRLIYPGSIQLLQAVLENSLQQGRARLIELYGAERFKLKTADGNNIDTMFVDRRNRRSPGETLVICCEGNAGFYEIGTMMTPIEAGYSVLGWNHPGFGGSTGMPYPSQEQNAMDAVMQFAINKLGFQVQNIIIFGWSIGGYTCSWAAMTYPEIKGVVIDATFDDILPLALNQMPKWWEPLVKIAIRQYVDLNVFEHLVKYSGPMLFIRRTKDEVICIREGDLSSNRGNHLLAKILKHRYPFIFESSQLQVLNDYLAVTGAEQRRILEKFNVNESICQPLLESYVSEYSKSFPMKIGENFSATDKTQMALFLALKHMKDFKATHCVSLPWDMFSTPWDVNVESDYVFT